MKCTVETSETKYTLNATAYLPGKNKNTYCGFTWEKQKYLGEFGSYA